MKLQPCSRKGRLQMVEQEISRRNFLKASALLGGGLLISFTIPTAGRLGTMVIPGLEGGFTPNAFLNIQPDNTITVVLSHTEMGQGIWTTLPMLIAEELDTDWNAIKVEHSPAGKPWNHTAYGIQITGGSSTTWSEFDRYRKAGAAARILLKQAAANRWRVNPDQLKTENGFVFLDSHTKLTYGELATEAAALPEPKDISLRPASTWKYVGKGKGRLDGPAKTNGVAKYGMDMQMPGMLTAVVAHSPVFGGKVISFDATRTKTVKGVRQVVQIPTGVAVLADNYWAANEGKKLLKIDWEEGVGTNLNTATQMAAYKRLAATNGLPAQQQGDVNAGFAGAAKIIEAEYVFPYLAHAPMEPLNCTVKITDGKCEIWSGTQLPGVDRDNAAKILGLKSEQVIVNIPFLGGGFGRRATSSSDFVSEAVYIAKNSHQAIKMVWSREDDMKGGYYRPAYVHKLKIGTDAAGIPVAWQHNIVGQSIMAGGMMAASIKNGIDDTSVEGVKESPYLKSVPNHYVGLHTTTEVVPVLWFRSVGNTHTGYVMETIIDELATNAGEDPLEYRRKLLKDSPRHLAALNLAADKAGWGKKLPVGHFQGIAVHEAFKSFVAEVAEISIDAGKLKVHKVICAIDCGLAVNPDGVRAQMESGIIFGLTMALYGELSIEKGQLQQNNFYDYKIARINETPVIDVHIVDGDGEMGGAGEPCVPPLAPALSNAIFAATGKRVYDLPLMNHNFTTS